MSSMKCFLFLSKMAMVVLVFLPAACAQSAETFANLYQTLSGAIDQNQAKTIVRLAFHDAMGGIDGRINSGDSEHNGLIDVFTTISNLYATNGLGLSRSDYYAWAYAAAFYMTMPEGETNIPWVPLFYGRANADCCAAEDIPPDSPLGSFNHAGVLDYFATNFGFSTSQTAIILGAHTLGGADNDNSGFVGDWTNSPNTFNAEYYDTMDDPPGGATRWQQVQVGDKFQWRWGCDGDNGCQDLMLNVDMSLLFDITYDSTGKAVLPSGSSCSSDQVFDDCFPLQSTGTQSVATGFIGQDSDFRSQFASVYGLMLQRVKTTATLTEIGQPDNWPDLLQDCWDMCFSKSTQVQVEHRGLIEMKDLQVGDRVWNGNVFEPVYAFGHRNDTEIGKFLTIYTDDTGNPPLEMTANHMVFKEEENGSFKAVQAGWLKVGDKLQTSSAQGAKRTVAVNKLDTAKREGMYMPFTPSGTIVVDGLVASNYVSIQRAAPSLVKNFGLLISDDKISHWWMSPYRMICLGVSPSLCNNLARDDRGILEWLIVGKWFSEFVDKQSLLVRVFVLGLPTFLIFCVINIVEVSLGGPSLAPLMLVSLFVLILHLKRQHRNDKKKTA